MTGARTEDAPIRLGVDGGLARITLNRPAVLNAFDEGAARLWREVTLEATSRDDVHAILLSGAGPAFCAGGDVRAMATAGLAGDRVAELAGVIHDGLLALIRSTVPVVAAVHGTTAGGGLGILLASDYAVAADDARFTSRYANIGLTPDLSVSAQLSAAVGERRALQLLLTDRMLTAQEALDWGLVAETVPAQRLHARAEEVAAAWLATPAAYGQAKRLLRSRPQRGLAEQLAEEAHTIGAAFDTEEATARIAAFVAR